MMIPSYQPLIIIGAARSGTKLLRDLIAIHPEIDKVPYDINYIWRMGNENVVHDELSPEQLTPQIRQKILKHLQKFRNKSPLLVEKTVSNTLRVPFVLSVFPNAKFIYLIRDGRDVVESVYRQWLAPPDWKYSLEKAMTFPMMDAFGYGFRYAQSLLKKLFFAQSATHNIWGVHYQGIEQDMLTKDLLEVCAIQWVRSVSLANEALNTLPSEQVITIHYEHLVESPLDSFQQIASFLNIDNKPYLDEIGSNFIDSTCIGKGLKNLNSQQVHLMMPYLEKTLKSFNYL